MRDSSHDLRQPANDSIGVVHHVLTCDLQAMCTFCASNFEENSHRRDCRRRSCKWRGPIAAGNHVVALDACFDSVTCVLKRQSVRCPSTCTSLVTMFSTLCHRCTFCSGWCCAVGIACFRSGQKTSSLIVNENENGTRRRPFWQPARSPFG